MLINQYRKTLNEIVSWLEATVVAINLGQQPVKICIREEENFQQHGVQRTSSALKKKY